MSLWEHELKNAYIGEYRVPGENTIAYYKFDGNLNDEMNSFNLTTKTGSISYGTLSGGDKYGIFNGSTILSVSSVPSWNKGTVSVWLNKTSSNEGMILAQNLNTNNSNDYTQFGFQPSNIIYWIPAQNQKFISYTLSLNTWHNVVCTQDGNGIKIYVDNNNVASWDSVSHWFNYYSSANQLCVGGLSRGTQTYTKMNGYMSNLILESKARTDQEVSDYYNLTKSLYGIS